MAATRTGNTAFSLDRPYQTKILTQIPAPFRSLYPLPKGVEVSDASLRFSLHFTEAVTRIYFGTTMMREILGFGCEVDRSTCDSFKVGVMGCSPLGKGTQVRFKDFQMDKGE